MILKRQDLMNESGALRDEAALAALAQTDTMKQLDPSQWRKDSYNLDQSYNSPLHYNAGEMNGAVPSQATEDVMATTTLPNPFATQSPAQPSANIFNPGGTVSIAPGPIQTPTLPTLSATAPRLSTQDAASNDGGRRLVVGAGISLGGEISTCDVLVIEGSVAATLKDCKHIEIAQGGLFKGNAEIDNALIAGNYEGNLVVRGTLHVAPGARITGSVRYAQLIVEAGAEINGEVQSLHHAPQPVARPNGSAKATRNGTF